MRRDRDRFQMERWRPMMDDQSTFPSYWDNLLDPFSEQQSNWGQRNTFVPSCDIEQTDSHILMTMDTPGLDKKDLHVELHGNHLVVSGERRTEKKESRRNRLYEERSYGSFQRSFTLPTAVDPARVEADYRDGVLRIAVPVDESSKPKQINIGEGKGGLIGKLFGRTEEPKAKEVKVA